MKFENDIYVINEIYQSYLRSYWGEEPVDAIHFNHASITPPLLFIHRAALNIQQENLSVDSERRLGIIERTRYRVSRLVNLKKECAVFANNTTDATSLIFWLIRLRKGCSVVTTDAENESIPRVFRYYMDHANPGDGWVAWQNFAQHSNSRLGLIEKRRTGVKVKTVKAYGFDDETFLESLVKEIDDSVKLVVFCHVLRENGRIMPVKKICESVREVNSKIYILVDGAQCLGTMPKIDFEELGCDFYVATPHKTLCSETTGILFMDQKHTGLCNNINNVPRDKQIIKKEQFSKKLAIGSNSCFAVSLPEIYALDLVIDYYKRKGWLVGNDFSAVDNHLRKLKKALIEKLGKLEAEIVSPISPKFTNFILSFRFRSLDNGEVVRELWNKNVFVSYIHRSDVIRASFCITNTLDEIDRFDALLRQIIAKKVNVC